MPEIIPAILTDSPIKFKALILRIEPYAKRVHIDIADGDFVPNKTINGYEEIMDTESALEYDIHLMVKKPQEVLKEWLYTHAERFIIHAESEGDLNAIIDELHANKRKVGLTINPETPVEKFEPYIPKVDFIQFMTVNPGFQGSPFVGEVVNNISAFHVKYPDIIIMCDGGITPETAPILVKVGASALISGSYIVKSESVEKAIDKLKEAVDN